MAGTRTMGVRVPDALLAAARAGLGMSADTRESDIVRTALAQAAGVNVNDYTPRVGRPPVRKARAA